MSRATSCSYRLLTSYVLQLNTLLARGNVDLTSVFPFLGNTELEVLAVLGSFLLIAMHSITAVCTKERVVVANRCVYVLRIASPLFEDYNLHRGARKGFLQEMKDIWDNVRNLPPVIRQIVRHTLPTTYVPPDYSL